MRITPLLLILTPILVTACNSARHARKQSDSPETVMVTYHVQSGMEADLRDLILRNWQIYRRENLVFAQPHVVVAGTEDGTKTRFVEIFTWVSHASPEHVPDSIKTNWNQMQALCEERNGHGGLEGGEVNLLLPPPR